MNDYESGEEGLSEEDEITHHVLFTENNPISFVVAVKNPKWLNAMDVEMEAIERKNTWVLLIYLQEKKQLGSSGFTRRS